MITTAHYVSDQPVYFQLFFALDHVRKLAPSHPEWQNNPTLRAAIDGDLQMLQWSAGGKTPSLQVYIHLYTKNTC